MNSDNGLFTNYRVQDLVSLENAIDYNILMKIGVLENYIKNLDALYNIDLLITHQINWIEDHTTDESYFASTLIWSNSGHGPHPRYSCPAWDKGGRRRMPSPWGKV